MCRFFGLGDQFQQRALGEDVAPGQQRGERGGEGVVEAEASASLRIRFEYDRSATGEGEIRSVLRSMGVRVQGNVIDAQDLESETVSEEDAQAPGHAETRGEDHGHDGGGIFGERTELILAILAGVCVATGFGLSFTGGVPEWVPWGLYVGGYVFGGYNTVREAIDTLRVGDFEVDFLMLVAAAGAAALGDDGAVSRYAVRSEPPGSRSGSPDRRMYSMAMPLSGESAVSACSCAKSK